MAPATCPHPTGSPRGKSVPLSPPTRFRARVIAPRTAARHDMVGEAVFDAILSYSNSLSANRAIHTWAQEILRLQESRYLPPASLSLVTSAAAFGLAAARLEREWGWEHTDHTAELTHDAMAIASYDNDDAEWLIRAVAIDGAYYIERTGHSATALAASL